MAAGTEGVDDDLDAVRDGIAAFLRREVFARYDRHAHLFDEGPAQYQPDGRIRAEVLALVREVRRAASSAGYYTMCVPSALGGGGMGSRAWFAAWEHIFHLCGGKYHVLGEATLAHWATGASVVLSHLHPIARERFLPGLVSGERSMCFALSEPQAGADALAMSTRAVADGNGWRISGNKIWTTNGPYADLCILFAVTDPERAAARQGGISAFIVPTSSPGFEVERVIRFWGHAGGNEALLAFEDLHVQAWQLVGELDRGFAIAMAGVNLGRLYNAARAVGLGRWALETAFGYVKLRSAFGQPLAQHQGVTFPLVDAAAQVHAAHLVGANVAAMLDAGRAARKELSLAKLLAVQAGVRAIDQAMQAHGAMGFVNEMHLAQASLMLRTLQVADGTNEILRRTVARAMLDCDLEL